MCRLAVVFSTFAIVIFGEIIPQAACSRYGLLVGAKTRYLTILFMALTGIISWPLSRVLDLILGKEIGTVYDRDKLQKLLEVTQMHTDIGNEEVNIVQGMSVPETNYCGYLSSFNLDKFELSCGSKTKIASGYHVAT